MIVFFVFRKIFYLLIVDEIVLLVFLVVYFKILLILDRGVNYIKKNFFIC